MTELVLDLGPYFHWRIAWDLFWSDLGLVHPITVKAGQELRGYWGYQVSDADLLDWMRRQYEYWKSPLNIPFPLKDIPHGR